MIKVLNQHLSGSLRIMNKSFSKLLFFLDKDDIKKTYYLISLFIFIGLIEVLGVISIMPFVGMITDPLYFGSNEFSLYIKNYLQIDDKLLTLILSDKHILHEIFIFVFILNIYTWLVSKYVKHSVIFLNDIVTNE